MNKRNIREKLGYPTTPSAKTILKDGRSTPVTCRWRMMHDPSHLTVLKTRQAEIYKSANHFNGPEA